MLESLLIANRGEIACRIIRTARAMGIRTVAVYSDADAQALHVRSADEAVHIGPAPVRESYLLGDRIIAAALQTGAQAIHPGYGFLSENAEFAQAVIDAGLIWVGPNPSSITAMGLKDAAKQLMQDAGVPTTPGYLGADQSPAHLAAQADAIGYPVLIKAVAGGGGKGMRKVDSPADFADALASCQREAASSFGNDHVLLEKWVTNPRHIEVQVFGDTHGNVVHLFERDCSLQRRHQKVIEEAPAPGMDAATREAICSAAVRAAKAVDYVGAGTIEFIADGSEGLRADRIWFMEMNTRLQVEHPVTEEITGVDLVEWQLRVASGEPLPKRQEELSINGHAMEARLYAENPATGFLPSTGQLDHLTLPSNERIETGVEEGDVISPFYDPMIAKIVSWGQNRAEALTDLRTACGAVECEPVRTNAWFLRRLLAEPMFEEGTVTTAFIGDHIDTLCAPPVPSSALLQYAADDLAFSSDHMPDSYGSPKYELTKTCFGFRLNAPANPSVRLLVDGVATEVLVGEKALWHDYARTIVSDGRETTYFEAGASFVISACRHEGAGGNSASDGAILSPMPGRIISVSVAAGDAVVKGQKLLTLEAMKMEHSLIAPFDGTVAELNASEGGQVSEGVLLAKIEKAEG
ncbi:MULTISPECIES: acetyl/propionyl/methylcrotonyl-CoA carboxylase subunit alpha [unclassified Sphingobium]|uniref:acetyl/propionyl/methylcrotonyl-CoA carboxylase subunit alpha n=1 Tax=unclassified Sphingobium TaxID=2611147 RepID=UPI000D16305D|nr:MULTISPECIES: acetyl/propionyl/methylcrotonyl-CoA carboxylase subunit alpha [unclassified Sphingobium]MBG6119699.1 3-methylcrotonyl-CoA carboxylase alpha subunit [Sphingobium sp. JAI105]PSO13433.1 methylcrotonoyl-CoA carboxylase [Sphingobium sp. AEW4]TWD11449.1 3-methylcrotonyl-CoA carboxylase alpha subunit [Sphingobium sp. AEW010]TWD28660.1 3-methylcrotonyl-CoA carboxylase alpha subunit [Sphingobium sp. AEW013]TWD29991.1 3-methylcrotonyl-CoA carboxylase alpha subunit [Sphingobium sp. AEW00